MVSKILWQCARYMIKNVFTCNKNIFCNFMLEKHFNLYIADNSFLVCFLVCARSGNEVEQTSLYDDWFEYIKRFVKKSRYSKHLYIGTGISIDRLVFISTLSVMSSIFYASHLVLSTSKRAWSNCNLIKCVLSPDTNVYTYLDGKKFCIAWIRN